MFNFYRCFIPKAEHILAPIVQFLEGHTNQKKSHSSVRKSSESLKWNENAEKAFLAAKNAIVEDLISQYSTDIRHVQGSENTVSDALSRIEIDSNTKSPILNFKKFALAQKNDPDLQKILQTDGSSLKFELKQYQTPDCNLLCDISTGVPRPFVPTSFRRALFNHLLNLSYPGIAASTKLICSRYVWPGMKCQIKKWVRCWESCQKSKIQRHTKTPLGTFSVSVSLQIQSHSHRYCRSLATILRSSLATYDNRPLLQMARSNPNSRHARENHLPRNFRHVDLSFWLPICNHLGSRSPDAFINVR
ncbi:pro-Pol polyprotein [Trichonephila clavipes]|uniref:RNA-directed DNA polymerase n=1 Tax=Trichonephila clavipes TaxID=2585209 RepID=A0A8X6V7S9_TRICX|nr:pro-Pol polyprotein [Trichonephila clavipes]